MSAPRTRVPVAVLVAAGPFGAGLPASRVVAAIERGLRAGGLEHIDLCPLACEGADRPNGELRGLLQTLDFDARMRSARALVVAEWHLQRATLEQSAAFEIATRARQVGVPAYAVTAENQLDAFDARMLDLQAILQARGARALAAAGRRLAQLM